MCKKSFSLITIVNKKSVYEDFKENLNTQKDVDYQLIRVKNDHNQFRSARVAYNQALEKATGDYIVFLHPDMRFLDKYALRDVLNQVTTLPNLGVAGISGCLFKLHHHRSTVVSTIVHGDPAHRFGQSIEKPIKVQTVDECFFVISREFCKQHPFSNIDGWHMYAVEQCLVALLNNKVNYVVPCRMWHRSTGFSENWQYIQTGRKIVQIYGKYFSSINTTVTTWNTKSKLNLLIIPPLKLMKHRLWRRLHLA